MDTTTTSGSQATGDFTESVAPESQPAIAQQPKTYRVKVDGQELTVTEEQLLKNFSLERSSRARMQEAAKARQDSERAMQQVYQIFEALKTSPDKVFSELGMDLDAIAEQRILEKIRREQMSPEQRRLAELEAKQKIWEEREKKEKEESERRAYEAQVAHFTEQIDQQLSDIVAASKVRVTPRTIANVAEIMLGAMERGRDMTLQEAFDRATNMHKSDLKDYLSTLDPDALEEFLGSQAEVLRKASLSKIKNPFAKKSEDAVPVPRGPRKLTDKDYWSRFNNKYNLR